MVEHKSKWWSTMLAKYGSEEAVREVMRAGQKKGRLNYKGTGGFAANAEKAREAGYKTAEKRWGYVRTNNTSTETTNDESR